jgi:hypothetical protein
MPLCAPIFSEEKPSKICVLTKKKGKKKEKKTIVHFLSKICCDGAIVKI